MWLTIACSMLLAQAGIGAPVCDGTMLMQVKSMVSKTPSSTPPQTDNPVKGNTSPAWFASDERFAEHDHRYQKFVNTLLEHPIECEHNSTFQVGAKAVDSQHQKLAVMVDQVRQLLYDRMEGLGFDEGLRLTGEQFKPLNKLLKWLKQYTIVHFDAEEKTMEELSYMHMVSHKAFHRAFYGHVMMWGEIVDRMMELNGSFHVGNVLVMIAKWWQDHICVLDKEVGKCIEESGKKSEINDASNPDGVVDIMPVCVPALVGTGNCASLLQGVPAPTEPAPEWWAPVEHVTAHDHWYRAFVNTLLQNPIVCEVGDSFDISVKAVDAQHHKLLTFVDKFRKLLLDRQQKLGLDDGLKLTGPELKPLHTVLVWLEQYGIVHFDAEEETMKKVDYPNFVTHKALHRAFYGNVMMAGEVVGEMMKHGAGFHVGPIFVFMGKWVHDHICVLDKNIGAFIKEHEHGAVESDFEMDFEIEDQIPDSLPGLEEGEI